MAIALSASGVLSLPVAATGCSMADEQFASLICSQLQGLRRQEENVTYYIYYMTIKLFPKGYSRMMLNLESY